MRASQIPAARLIGASCLLLMVPLFCWGQDNAAATAKAAQEQSFHQLVLDLHQAQSLLPSVADTGTREQLSTLLTDAQTQANALPQVPAAAPKAAKAIPVSASQFTQVLKGLTAETFDDGKVSYIKQISKSRHFTSAQARRLLTAFTFDEGREDAAVALYPQVVDQDNFLSIFDVFTFDEGRSDVRRKLDL